MDNIAYFRMPKVASGCITNAAAGRCVILVHGPERERRTGVLRFRKEHPGSYIFTFVRNPFDRLLSAYSYLKSSKLVYAEDLSDRDLYIKPYKDFKDFVMRGVGEGLVLDQKHIRPQYLWITDENGKLLTNWVGHYENLQAEFNGLCWILKWKLDVLSVTNKSSHGVYQASYDNAMRDIVVRVYGRDFEIGGYKRTIEQSSLGCWNWHTDYSQKVVGIVP